MREQMRDPTFSEIAKMIESHSYIWNHHGRKMHSNRISLTAAPQIKGNSGYCRFWTPLVYVYGINRIELLNQYNMPGIGLFRK